MPDSSPLSTLSDQLSALARAIQPRLVTVLARRRWPSTGFVWRDDLIVCTAHALGRGRGIRITRPDGVTVEASVVGYDAASDLAVLKAAGTPASSFDVADAAALQVGAAGLVVASASAALAIVERVAGERIVLDLGRRPGLSGGVFVAATGAVAGVVTAGLAWRSIVLIPMGEVERIAQAIVEKGHVPTPFLGIGGQGVRLQERVARSLGMTEGVLITATQPDGPADSAGWLIGDILVEIAGRPVHVIGDVRGALAAAAIGASTPARLVRGDRLVEVPIQPAERPRAGRCCG